MNKKDKKVDFSRFFKLPAKEQKKAIKEAVVESNKKQIDLMKEYEKRYPKKISLVFSSNSSK
jgi:TRAP-type C4-dicarboxylate transport system substrate-binding protein